jgi:hypothetical protein
LFNAESIFNYNVKGNVVNIQCDEEGQFIVVVSNEYGKEIVTGFRLEKSSTLIYNNVYLNECLNDVA